MTPPTAIGENLITTYSLVNPCPENQGWERPTIGLTYRVTTGPTQFYVRKHGFAGAGYDGLEKEQILPSNYNSLGHACVEANGLNRFCFIASVASAAPHYQDIVSWWPGAPSTSIFATPVADNNLAFGPIWDYASDDGIEPIASRIYWIEHNFSTNLVTAKRSDPGFASVETLATYAPPAGYTSNMGSAWLGETILSFPMYNGSNDRIRIEFPRDGSAASHISYDLQFAVAASNQRRFGVPVTGGCMLSVLDTLFIPPWDDGLFFVFVPDSPTGANDFTKWGFLGCDFGEVLNVNGDGLVTLSGGKASTTTVVELAVFEPGDFSTKDFSDPPCGCDLFEFNDGPTDELIRVISALS